MRRNIVVGNWKMNLTRDQALILTKEIMEAVSTDIKVDIILSPSYLYLYKIGKICENQERIFIAAQDCHQEKEGAFTSCISSSMIKSCNIQYVILGHSEVRDMLCETNYDLKLKVNQVLSNKIGVIFCCGEPLDQREKNKHFEWIEMQIKESLFHLSELQIQNIIIAYEPIWAIGSGNPATADDAQNMHMFIRDMLKEHYGDAVSQKISILYGGSCNTINSNDFFGKKDIDGGLIGGASLNSSSFIEIVNSF